MIADFQKEYDSACPEIQSTFTWWIGDTYAGNFGPERSLRLKPLATFLKKGIKWGGGSDFAVTPFPARYGIWASIVRKPLRGAYGNNPFEKEEAVDMKTALRSYTIWNAYVMFMENKIGSVEEGKYADLALWDRNMYAVSTEEIEKYGYQWWRLPVFRGYEETKIPRDILIALGIFTQQIFIIPTKDLLVVRLGHDPDPDHDEWRELEFLSLVLNSLED